MDVVKTARNLRQNQTDAEKKLWRRLRDRQLNGCKFRRQHPIPPYIVDFFCEEIGLIVEVDGGQHTPEKDAKRSEFLNQNNFKILRFWNNEVLGNIEGVLEMIKKNLPPDPSPLPSPKGEGEKRVCLGKITSAHGVKGLVKILPFGEDPLLIEELSPVFTGESSSDQLSITMKNSAGNKYWLAAVDGVVERDGAEALRGTEIWVERDALPKIKEKNTFYHTDLIGLSVTEDGKEIGTVVNVQNYGAGDLLEIKANGSTFLFPFTNDTCPEINVKGGFVSIVNSSAYMDLK
ncbi:MAG TPA: ribosome maturation factor RimM [Alphaproteobacteria bacterium]|nr:16S rRNA processing protein RimM [Micavibrio sp.]HQX27939.1 ribosome maturation factor RimM [Alphaproteobacteria bacterium]